MNFLIGLILLILLLSAIKQFARLDAAAVARAVRNGTGVLGLIGALILALRGRIGLAAALAGVAASFAGWQKFGGNFSPFQTAGPGAGRVSTARSAMLEMRLDHESGAMSGEVRRGAFAGRQLEDLNQGELLTLWRQCVAEDEQGARLLETYLDRLRPDWRQGADGGAAPGEAMTRAQAYAILDLAPGATAAQIKEAHHRLMMKLHPDHGGSTFLAAQINRAKDILLGE